MKKLFLFAFLCLVAHWGFAQDWQVNGNTIYYFVAGGKIGLNTNNPTWDLTSRGGLKLEALSNPAKSLEFAHGGTNGFVNMVGGGRFDFRQGGANRLSIAESGNVGIGTTTPASPLSVNGKVESEEVQVIVDVPDFVFEPSYEVMTFGELEQFISENKHLPKMFSVKDARNNRGFVPLGQFSAGILENLEQSVLRQIELNKKVENLEKENQDLKGEMAELRKQNEEILQLLKSRK